MPVNINKEQFLKLRKDGNSLPEVAKIMGFSEATAKRFNSKLKEELSEADLEVIQENVKLAKTKQRYQDLNRIERKAFREHVRLENSVAELQKEVIALLDKKSLPKTAFRSKKIKTNRKNGAILHLTDLHFNELINLLHNRYDFNVASQRLKKFVDDAKKYLKVNNTKDVCVAMTGDLLNSDRRLDEKLSQATNRAKAVLLSVTLLEQVLLDLQKDFNVSVAHVIGNESRITEDIGWVEEVASDNYDTIIHGMLKRLFKNSKIKFFEGNSNQRIVEIVGQNILLQHGHQNRSTNAAKNFQSVKGLSASQGVVVDFVISGHYHNCKIGDTFAQSSSLAGSNAYSNDALQLESRASQNLHIFFENGNRDSIKIDLQNAEDVEGYPIDKDLEAYNAKSIDKSKKKVTVHKIVI